MSWRAGAAGPSGEAEENQAEQAVLWLGIALALLPLRQQQPFPLGLAHTVT